MKCYRKRDMWALRINTNRARQDVYFCTLKRLFLALYSKKYFFNILLYCKVLKQDVAYILRKLKHESAYLIQLFNIYKFKRFLSGIDYIQINTP